MKPTTPKTKLAAIRNEIGDIEKNGNNPYFKNTYIELPDLLDAINPVLQNHSCLLEQPQEIHGDFNVQVSRIICLDSGEVIGESMLVLPINSKPHEVCGATTYYRRYTLLSLLALKAKDDDGNEAMGMEKPSPQKGTRQVNARVGAKRYGKTRREGEIRE